MHEHGARARGGLEALGADAVHVRAGVHVHRERGQPAAVFAQEGAAVVGVLAGQGRVGVVEVT